MKVTFNHKNSMVSWELFVRLSFSPNMVLSQKIGEKFKPQKLQFSTFYQGGNLQFTIAVYLQQPRELVWISLPNKNKRQILSKRNCLKYSCTKQPLEILLVSPIAIRNSQLEY